MKPKVNVEYAVKSYYDTDGDSFEEEYFTNEKDAISTAEANIKIYYDEYNKVTVEKREVLHMWERKGWTKTL